MTGSQQIHLPVVDAICPRGHRTGVQAPSGAVIRCGRCFQKHGTTVTMIVPDRGAAPSHPAARAGREPRRVTRAPWVARGVAEVTCTGCGLPVWRARLSPEAMGKAGYRNHWAYLEPRHASPGESRGLVINSDGQAVWSGRFPSDYVTHRCPGRVVRCKYCGAPVRVLHQPPGSPERLAVIDADEDPGAIVAVDEHGYAVRDPDRQIDGPRYRWHERHVPADRGAEVSYRNLMTSPPAGRRS